MVSDQRESKGLISFMFYMFVLIDFVIIVEEIVKKIDKNHINVLYMKPKMEKRRKHTTTKQYHHHHHHINHCNNHHYSQQSLYFDRCSYAI